jgi:hypothetical protein
MSEETVNAEGTATAAPVTESQQSEFPKRHLRKTRVGEVVSNKMDKTIVVEVVRRVPHPKFGKIVKRTKKLYAHDGTSRRDEAFESIETLATGRSSEALGRVKDDSDSFQIECSRQHRREDGQDDWCHRQR